MILKGGKKMIDEYIKYIDEIVTKYPLLACGIAVIFSLFLLGLAIMRLQKAFLKA